jgi:hypothetical protein
MNRAFVVLASVAVLAVAAAAVFAALYVRKEPETRRVVVKPCGDRMFGHISSIARHEGKLELRFDPAWFTSGVTANTAAAEDGAIEPGQPVPNDNYVVEEGHRLLTYILSPTAHVGVLAKSRPGVQTTPITVSELERIVNGGRHRPLLEPLDSGVWIRVHIDTVCSLEQQYRP